MGFFQKKSGWGGLLGSAVALLLAAPGCETYRTVKPSSSSLKRFAEELPKIYPSQLPPVPAPTEFMLYAANGPQNTVSSFKVNIASGKPTLVGSVAAGQMPYVIAVHPQGRYVYASNVVSEDISAYRVGASGALMPIGSYPVRGTAPTHVTISPDGRFVYATLTNYALPAGCTLPGQVAVFKVDQATGALEYVNQYATNCYPHSITFEPSGKYAYVANYLDHSILVYEVDAATGAIYRMAATENSDSGSALRVPFGSTPRNAAVHPSGKYLYVSYEERDFIGVFEIAPNGKLKALPEVPFGTPGTPAIAAGISIDPSGKYLFASNRGEGRAYQYSINAATGALSFVASYASGPWTMVTAFDPSGGSAFVAAGDTNTFASFKLVGGLAILMGDVVAGPEMTPAPVKYHTHYVATGLLPTASN